MSGTNKMTWDFQSEPVRKKGYMHMWGPRHTKNCCMWDYVRNKKSSTKKYPWYCMLHSDYCIQSSILHWYCLLSSASGESQRTGDSSGARDWRPQRVHGCLHHDCLKKGETMRAHCLTKFHWLYLIKTHEVRTTHLILLFQPRHMYSNSKCDSSMCTQIEHSSRWRLEDQLFCSLSKNSVLLWQ